MKQDENNKSPQAAEAAATPQTFEPNAERARNLFMELLDDGKEHTTKEVYGYIYDKTGGRDVNGSRLTDEMIHSAVWYMFRNDCDISYYQTRKGCYRKNTVENLLSSGTGSLQDAALKVLLDARETLRKFSAIPSLSEQERERIEPAARYLLGLVNGVIQDVQICGNLNFSLTTDNLKINDKLMIEEDRINASFEMRFDVDRRFGTSTYGFADYLNLYADYYQQEERLDVYYFVNYANGNSSDAIEVELFDFEREDIMTLMRDAGLYECIAEMREEIDESARLELK